MFLFNSSIIVLLLKIEIVYNVEVKVVYCLKYMNRQQLEISRNWFKVKTMHSIER